MKVVKPGAGSTDVDVIGPYGEYIVVGGPAKAKNLADLGHRLSILRYAADRAGVKAHAWFEHGTPKEVFEVAARKLGRSNVHTFWR